jgi:hypothetical protein
MNKTKIPLKEIGKRLTVHDGFREISLDEI